MKKSFFAFVWNIDKLSTEPNNRLDHTYLLPCRRYSYNFKLYEELGLFLVYFDYSFTIYSTIT